MTLTSIIAKIKMVFTTLAKATKQVGVSYLGGINTSAKLEKNGKVSHQYTYILYLAPAKTSGYNVCSHSTNECRMGCLATSGHAGIEINTGKSTTIRDCRIKKTRLFFENPTFFMAWMIAEMQKYQRKAIKDGYGFSVRLNGTSDIDWANALYEGQNIFQIFPDVQFYDYTKNPNKFNGKPTNYHLTFSYTGFNASSCKALLEQGQNVAVVFDTKKGKPMPAMFLGYPVIDGDLTDYRPNDGNGVIVGLRFKKIANKKDAATIQNQGMFVVKANELTPDGFFNVHYKA